MQFNTLHFAIFFIIVYLIYVVLRQKWQNLLLLLAGYVFYSFWDWRFLSVIIISTILNYYLGIKIEASTDEKKRKFFMVWAVCLNLAILGFFKYSGFFVANFQALLGFVGIHTSRASLNIVLPLGISFYTFIVMTYTIDINRGAMKPTRNFLDFALFVSFFPTLVAGPIERARNLLPQIQNKRAITREQFYEGCWLIFWGLYKKIVVADNLAKITRPVFEEAGHYAGREVLLAAYAFAFQIYADFSGYSDMARGLARLMGFELMANFNAPFFARNVYDLWQRWHISLTTWIKEYVFYPLALAKFRGRQLPAPLVIILTWSLMGFWHGASWKFVLWGLYHGALVVIYSRLKPYLSGITINNPFLKRVVTAAQIFLIFNLFCLGILFFACGSVSQVLYSFKQIFFYGSGTLGLDLSMIAMIPFLVLEYRQFRSDDELVLFKWPLLKRVFMCYIILYCILLFGDFGVQKYYYFQF